MTFEKPKKVNWSDDILERFWNYQAIYCPENFFTFQFGDKILKKISCYLRECQTILDYGCGAGSMIAHFLKIGLKTSGLDFSKNNVEIVIQKYGGNKNFASAYNIDEIEKINQKFDSLMCFEVLEHLNDTHLKITVDNFKRFLKEGGILIVTTPNNEDIERSNIYCPNCNSLFHKWQHVRSWNKGSLTSFLQQNGFDIEDIYPTDFSGSLKRNSFRFLHSLINRPRNIFARKLPHLVCIARLHIISETQNANSI